MIGYCEDPKKFLSKWKEKGKKMLMIGYGTNHTGDTYKMFDPVSRTMRLSRDIKWLVWTCPDPGGTLQQKSRVCSKGYKQIPGIDYKESFALVATDTTVRIVICVYLYMYKEEMGLYLYVKSYLLKQHFWRESCPWTPASTGHNTC
jgi:hypothetical protein